MRLTHITNEQLAYLYVSYKRQLKVHKKRQSIYDLNKCLETKSYLSIVKQEMKNRGLKKKVAKKLVNN